MADKQVFDVVNRNHQCQAILDRIVIDLDICTLKASLDAISSRRRKRKCTELAHIVEQTWTRVNRATAWMMKTLTQIKKRRCPPAPPQIPSEGDIKNDTNSIP